jgi:hypothetical protein
VEFDIRDARFMTFERGERSSLVDRPKMNGAFTIAGREVHDAEILKCDARSPTHTSDNIVVTTEFHTDFEVGSLEKLQTATPIASSNEFAVWGKANTRHRAVGRLLRTVDFEGGGAFLDGFAVGYVL